MLQFRQTVMHCSQAGPQFSLSFLYLGCLDPPCQVLHLGSYLGNSGLKFTFLTHNCRGLLRFCEFRWFRWLWRLVLTDGWYGGGGFRRFLHCGARRGGMLIL